MLTKPNSYSEQELKETLALYRDTANHGTFAEYCIAIDPRYQLEYFHEIIANKLQAGYEKMKRGENVRLAIFMPPRNGKSDTSTQKFPSWVLGKDPTLPIMVSSYSDELATDFGMLTRSIMTSDPYEAMFDTKLRADAKAKGKWITNGGGSYTAVGVGGALTGRGFKIGIIDDPFKNREEANSPVVRESRYNWYRSTFYTRAEGNSMIVLILTRWHEDDLAGRLLKDAAEAKARGEAYDDWDVVQFKAIATEDDAFRKEGEALWPAKFPLSQLHTIKSAIGTYEFSALYQQNPVDEESRKFKKSWFQYRKFDDVREKRTYNTMTIDPRGKDDIMLGKDFVGVTINLVDAENNWNLMSQRTKLSATGLIDLMFTNWQRYNLKKIGIENGQFWQGLKSKVKDEMQLRGTYLHIEELKTGGTQKELRIESSLVPRYENGGIYHLKDGDVNLCEDLEEELLLFPKATNDDASDSAAYQEQIVKRPVEESAGSVASNNISEYFNQ